MTNLIAKDFKNFKVELISLITNVEVVFLTADSWSLLHRAFLEIIIQWLEPNTLTRVFKALALKHFFGN